jgi:signal transduction histidine kinase/ligand-binding sensor domain-containing protein
MDATGRLWIIMGNESATTSQDGAFHLHREPRVDPRMRIDRVLTVRDDEVLFACGGLIAAKATITPEKTRWSVCDPRPRFNILANTLASDRDGTLWTLTQDKKVICYQNTWLVPPALENLLSETKIVALAADPARNIWIATPHRILAPAAARELAFADVTPRDGPAPEAIVEIAFSGDGGLWVLEKTRLRKYLNGRWGAEITSPQLLQHTAAGTFSLHGDTQGNLWIISFGRGLWHAKTDGTATLLDEQNGLPSPFVTCWFQDNEGNVWIGTAGGGVARIRESIFTTLGPAQGLPGKVVSSTCQDNNGTLWVGTMSGNLARWKNDRFEKIPLPAFDDGNPAAGLTVHPAPDGGLWIGTVNHGLMRMRNGQIRPLRNWADIRVLFGDSRGNTWVCPLVGLSTIRNGRVTTYNTPEGFEGTHAVGAIAEDAAGAIWIGTGPGDLWKFENNRFTKHTPPAEWRAGRISAVLPDTGGAIWVGTLGGGLLRFHNGAFTRCTKANGLPDDNISQLLDSGDGHLWAGTYAGIFRADKNELAKVAARGAGTAPVRIYGRFDGLPALECSSGFQPACWRAPDGMLRFSTASGVVSVNPAKVVENQNPPAVLIEEIIVDGEHIKLPPPQLRIATKGKRPVRSIEIAPGQHHVQFQVTGLNFTAPDGVRFRVKLDGADTEWRDVNGRRLIGYGPLLPGKYRFHVIACNNDGVWNETGDTIDFKVLPHFWETTWFKAFLILIILALPVSIVATVLRNRYKHRLQKAERQREMERERTRIAQDLHDDLGTSLTRINMLGALASCDDTPPAETREIIHEMDGCARNMVTALDEIVWAVNPKNDSWYELVNYLGFFAEEFFQPTNIRCRLDIPPQIPSRPLLSEERHHIFLAVKEALNNVARHSGATQVNLRITMHNAHATICVEDDGCGFDARKTPASTGGNGLKNIRHRMEQVGGTVTLGHPSESTGTIVIFKVPL